MKIKKTLSVLFALILLLGLIPTSLAEKSEISAPKKRYIVLALEISMDVSFSSDGETIYTASSALPYVKEAAIDFISGLKASGDENYVSLLVYFNTTVQCDFTDDLDGVIEQIGLLQEMGRERDLSRVFYKSKDLFKTVTDPEAEKCLVLVSTGMADSGFTSPEGPFDETSPGSEWIVRVSNVPLWKYANGAIDEAERLRNDGIRIYAIGIFQSMEGMPEKGQGVATLFRETVKEIASEDSFFPVEEPQKVADTFKEVTQMNGGEAISPEFKPGDVDGNGEVEVTDARLALQAAVGLQKYAPGSREFLAADTDGNQEIEVTDARNILRAAVGLDDPKTWGK